VASPLRPAATITTLDGKTARPLARYFGGFNVAVFTPEDLALPRASPGDRRRFLDRRVFNLRPDYLATAQDYERDEVELAHRTRKVPRACGSTRDGSRARRVWCVQPTPVRRTCGEQSREPRR
jgi:hypothetical protein